MKLASSLILCRPLTLIETSAYSLQTGNFKVLMTKRNKNGSFASLQVFPGGALDEKDDLTHWNTHSNNKQLDSLKICAVREAFEECGVCLLDPPVRFSQSQMKEFRDLVHQDANEFVKLNKTYSTQPNIDKLIHFAHWITPEHEPRRFDTHFFLSLTEDKGDYEHSACDGSETVHMEWITPKEALHKFGLEEINLLPPQFCTLTTLSDYTWNDIKDIVSGKQKLRRVEPILPRKANTEDSVFMLMKGDHEFPETLCDDRRVLNRLKFGRTGKGFYKLAWIRSKQNIPSKI